MPSEARPAAMETAAYLTLLGLAVAALLVLCLRVAASEWFSSDDFATLNEIQRRSWSWFDTFLPLESRTRWFYRPLGVNTWFYLNFQAFELNATPYFAQAVVLHFATGFVTLRIARQLGFSLPVAALAATLSVSRFASMDRIYYGALFSYVAAVFLSAVAISLLIDYARRGSSLRLAGACLAYFLTLLCHEYAVVYVAILPAVSLVARGGRPTPREIATELHRCAPFLGITGAYLILRFFLIAESSVESPYFHLFGWNLARNYRDYWFLVGGGTGLLALAAVAGASGAVLAGRREEMRDTASWLVSIDLLCVFWVSVSVVLFLTQPIANSRYGVLIEIPACLLFASHVEVLWRRFGPQHARAMLVAFALLAVAAMPFASVAERATSPRRPHPGRFIELLETSYPQLSERGRVVILYGAPGLASVEEGRELGERFYGRTAMLRALVPEKELSLHLHDMEIPPSGRVICRHCVYFELLPGLHFEMASDATLRELFERGTRSSSQGVRKLSSRALVALDGKLSRRDRQGDPSRPTERVKP